MVHKVVKEGMLWYEAQSDDPLTVLTTFCPRNKNNDSFVLIEIIYSSCKLTLCTFEFEITFIIIICIWDSFFKNDYCKT
jgi:hypothetical protein